MRCRESSSSAPPRDSGVFADSFLALERAHLVRLAVWGAASVFLGLVLLLLGRRPARSPLLFHFGLQTALWGAIDLAFVVAGWQGLALRDLQGAARVERLLWLNLGLDVGYVGIGATIAIAAWILGRRLGGVGAGIGIVVQGLALFLLDARFLVLIHSFV